MSAVVLLDAGPLGLLAHTRASPVVLACRQWLTTLTAAHCRVIVPEITDFEVRRELLRIQQLRGVGRLDVLAVQLEYLTQEDAALSQTFLGEDDRFRLAARIGNIRLLV